MKRYETVLRIVNYAEDMFEAGEKAGELIDLTKYYDGEIFISCEPTREIGTMPLAIEMEPEIAYQHA
jgi:hypothetical protein